MSTDSPGSDAPTGSFAVKSALLWPNCLQATIPQPTPKPAPCVLQKRQGLSTGLASSVSSSRTATLPRRHLPSACRRQHQQSRQCHNCKRGSHQRWQSCCDSPPPLSRCRRRWRWPPPLTATRPRAASATETFDLTAPSRRYQEAMLTPVTGGAHGRCCRCVVHVPPLCN